MASAAEFPHGQLGLARGKRTYDKRQTIRKREEEREMKRVTRGRRGS